MPFALNAQAQVEKCACPQLIELTLKNGMRVCLKHSSLEPKEFDLQIVATGGYASLPIADQPSAWLATEIAWRSGLDQKSGDELECALDDHSIEMHLSLDLFERQIEASGPIGELSYCLRLIRLLFTQPQFNETGLKDAITHARQQLLNRAKSSHSVDGDLFTKINMRNWHMLTPFNVLDLNKVELKKSEELFKKFFHNPLEFIFVLVGDFDVENIIPLLDSSLGSLPSSPITHWARPLPPPFPDGITKKEFTKITRYKTSQTRMTFPLPTQAVDPIALELLCILLKQRFLVTTNDEQWKGTIKVSHRFPLFPYLDPSWLVFKFMSTPTEVETISRNILKTLEEVKQNGFTEQEIKAAYREWLASRSSASDNNYELSLLANYCRVGWDIRQLYPPPNQEIQVKTILKKILECYPNTAHYSLISFHP